jgi:transcriptional regulator with XRE-family HTH domain
MKNEFAITVGKNIRALRELRRLTLRGLQHRIGFQIDGKPILSCVSISRIERGEQELTFTNLERISRGLGCNVEWLITSDNASVQGPLVIESAAESEIILNFRRLNEQDRDQVINFIKFLSKTKR